jgi:hypothetical protein
MGRIRSLKKQRSYNLKAEVGWAIEFEVGVAKEKWMKKERRGMSAMRRDLWRVGRRVQLMAMEVA